jgi:hypothetical protein
LQLFNESPILQTVGTRYIPNNNREREKMQEISFGSSNNVTRHECEAQRDGEWLIFRCPICPDYERRMNWRTGETFARQPYPEIQHSGFHFSHELISSIMN